MLQEYGINLIEMFCCFVWPSTPCPHWGSSSLCRVQMSPWWRGATPTFAVMNLPPPCHCYLSRERERERERGRGEGEGAGERERVTHTSKRWSIIAHYLMLWLLQTAAVQLPNQWTCRWCKSYQPTVSARPVSSQHSLDHEQTQHQSDHMERSNQSIGQILSVYQKQDSSDTFQVLQASVTVVHLGHTSSPM